MDARIQTSELPMRKYLRACEVWITFSTMHIKLCIVIVHSLVIINLQNNDDCLLLGRVVTDKWCHLYALVNNALGAEVMVYLTYNYQIAFLCLWFRFEQKNNALATTG
jgi:hypothetical protein